MSLTLVEVADRAADCRRCELADYRTQVVFGAGKPDADLMFIGEGPGAEEDEQGVPFVGRSGKLLDRLMAEEVGLTRANYYIANVVKCRPPNNRNPKPAEIAACRPWLNQQLKLIAPKVVVTLGNFPSRLLLNTETGITKLRGQNYQLILRQGELRSEVIVIPTFHPAAVLRGGLRQETLMRADLLRAGEALKK